MKVLLLLTILVLAVIQDLRHMKIRNRLLFVGLIMGAGCRLLEDGIQTLPHILLNISLPVLSLYLLYALGAFGAGDVKLLSVIGTLLTTRQVIMSFWCALVLAAGVGFIRLLTRRELFTSLFRVRNYAMDLCEGKWYSYRTSDLEKSHLIPFSLYIALGVVFILLVERMGV